MLLKNRLANANTLGLIYVLLSGWGVAYGLYYSLDWPLYQDASVLHYIAWRLLNGAAPYRDIFDMNMPGAYVLDMICLALLGKSDWALRLYDIFFCLLATSGFLALSWRQSKLYALAGSLLFIAYHLSCGAQSMAERDFFIVPFLLFAALVFRSFLEKPAKPAILCIFGILCGYALWIKPVAALFPAFCIIVVLFQSYSTRQKITALFYTAAGIVCVSVIMLCWLYRLGVMADFYDVTLHFSLQFYARIQPLSLQYKVFFLLFSAYGFIAALFILFRRSTVAKNDKIILVIGLLYGLLHFYLQDKGFWYHTYPLRAFICLYFMLVMSQLRCRVWERAIIYCIALATCLHFTPLDALSKAHLDEYKQSFSLDYIAKVSADVDDALQQVPAAITRPYLLAHPSGGVQFVAISVEHGLWDVAYRSAWVVPSKYIYPYPLYGIFHSSYMDGLAMQMYRDYFAIKPLVIIITRFSWPYNGDLISHTIDTKQPWVDFFSTYYRLSKETENYRIYARKH